MSEFEEDFAALFEASEKTAKQFEKGQLVEGTIVSIGPKVALVNIGAKSEAEIEAGELKELRPPNAGLEGPRVGVEGPALGEVSAGDPPRAADG